MTTFVPIIDGGEEVVRVPYIYYLVQFQEKQIRALLNSNSEINAMNPNFAQKLGLKIWKTNVGAQKIDSSTLEIFEMIIIDFQIEGKTNRLRFFQKAFFVANTKFEIILRMFFLKFSNADVLFGKKILM